jgi:hypothetical protein
MGARNRGNRRNRSLDSRYSDGSASMNLTGSEDEDFHNPEYNDNHYRNDLRDNNAYNMQGSSSMAGNMGQ